MTRHTAPTRNVVARLSLEATGERDESSGFRHKWVTRLRLGELTAEGPNAREAADNLAAELLALASCPEAVQALAMVRHRLSAARSVAEAPPKPAAPFPSGAFVEVLVADAWGPAEYLAMDRTGHHAVWSERYGSLVLSDDRIRAVNRLVTADVG